MKNRVFALFLVICMGLGILLSGCDQTQYTVQFKGNYDGCQEMAAMTVTSGKKLAQVDVPVREGYVFLGWYTDAGLTNAWDLQKDKVKSDMTLYAAWDQDTGDDFAHPTDDKDFSSLRTPGSQESAYEYLNFFLPEMDGTKQPYVGDPMPYYEDGVYYIYYLKDGGDSFNHSIYLATTTDFVTYTEYDDPVLEASRSGGQDSWTGTGSVVKVEDKYYLFYTGHNSSGAMTFKEKVMVAVGDTPTSFTKVTGWEITPDSSLGQKNDFRDPQAYYDPETGIISMTITASQGNVARIIKYSVSADLQSVTYDGIIFSNPVGDFWNLECTDTFCIGDVWYVTYSAQDDTLWYATSQTPYGPYSEPKRLEGKLFYAAKHVEDGENSYMVGWARRSESASSTQDVAAWGGNLVVQKIVQKENGDLVLAPVDAIVAQFTQRRELLIEGSHIFLQAGSRYSYSDVFTCYESYMLTGEFTFSGTGSFGLAFDFNGKENKYKMISVNPSENKVQLLFNEGDTLIAENQIELEAGKTYSFTYIQEGSVGVFYIDGIAALTVRIYGASGKPVMLFAENNGVLFSSLRQYTR